MNEHLVEYWLAHYTNPVGCTLCGNSGVIDSRSVFTAAGGSAGRLNWCICPNGQTSREHSRGELPTDTGR